MNKKWKVLSNIKKFTDQKQITDVLLANRGISEADKTFFFNGKLADVTCDFVELDKTHLSRALERIKKGVEKNEKIIIYGDYDVDGISGTTILWETLYDYTKTVLPYIPHRVDEGYGLSIKGIENVLLKHPDVKVIITVDNGIVAYEAADFAAKQGIDVIITDHHVRSDESPTAYAIVHTTKLCGAGVSYLLSSEIRKLFPHIAWSNNHLELVAIATVCDLVPLKEANRILLKEGLKALRKTNRLGLIELFKEAGVEKGNVGVYEIGHIIGPRINAMGRLFHGMDSLRLLCSRKVEKAAEFASKLSLTNRERQLLTEETARIAKSLFQEEFMGRVIIAADKAYNQGIIGLVASKLVEEFYRPSFVISVSDEVSKGSARSIPGVNIIEMIRSVSDTLIQAGGHPMAAGFSLETSKIEEFRVALLAKAEELVKDEHLERVIMIDTILPFSIIDASLFKEIQTLSPFGMGNPEPMFASYGIEVADLRLIGKDRRHLRLLLRDDDKLFEAIAFGFGENNTIQVGDFIDVAYCLDENRWNGKVTLQLKIRDLKKRVVD